MTEFELIARYFTRPNRSAILGNGDDCAIVAPGAGNAFAVTTDTLVEGRHFLPTLDPFKLGRRVVNVNFSDLAAMGAAPRYALLSLTLPQIDEDWISRLSVGLWSVLDAYDVELIGGNTTKGPLAIAMTAFGEVPPDGALKRSGARAGDELWVSGTLGDAGWAMYALTGTKFEATPEQISKYECPEARVSLGIALRRIATSCIDISDGLLSEAKHIAKASKVSIDIDIAAIPTGLKHVSREPMWDLAKRFVPPFTADSVDATVWPAVLDHLGQYCLLSTGDAYELLFTAPREQHDAVTAILKRENLPGACIGRVTAMVDADAGNPVRVLDAQSRVMDIEVKGWDHFA